jgi:NAD(P)-dependent dehydrogenase (short-subunit alcohol dehydrogenase family)
MDRESQPILVTGASTGIGRHLAERLADLGHPVFATARKPADLESLARIPGVEPVRLDVRSPADIDRAVRQVEARGRGLYGLVNNAGLGGLGLLATWSEEELLEIFDVNALAPIRVTRAFLPLLVRSQGRVVNIGSQGGSISMRYFGPYTMTKHAIEAFTVSLAEELEPYGVGVSIVQPGGIVSAIGENSLSGTTGRFRRAGEPFIDEAAAVLASLEPPPADPAPDPAAAAASDPGADPAADPPESETSRKPSSPEIVAVAVLDALFAERPRRRYLVGTRWEGHRVLAALMDRLLDANACPTLGHTLEELIDMLRERTAKEAP